MTGDPDLIEYVAASSAVIQRAQGQFTLPEGARLRVGCNDSSIAPRVLERLIAEGKLRPVAAWRRGARIANFDF